MDFDLGHLMVTRAANIIVDTEAALRSAATDDVQALLGGLFQLPSVSLDGDGSGAGDVAQAGSSMLVQLPKPEYKLPRAQPVPEPKPETKWEKFAKEKGIVKRKRERMVWDELHKEFRPRWGYKRANDVTQDPIVELKSHEDGTVDKFAANKAEKKLRVLKNRQAKLKNQEKAMRASGKFSSDLPSGLADDLVRGRGQGKGRERTADALKRAQVSTASLGKFDAALAGEPAKKATGKRRKFLASETVSDNARDLKVLDRLLGRSSSSGTAPPPSKKKKMNKGKKKRK